MYLYRFLCIRKEKLSSPGDALRDAIDSSPSCEDHSPNELLQLCSGQFPNTPRPQNGTQTVRELLGLEPGMRIGLDTQDSESESEDLVGLCSGIFPSSQMQHQPQRQSGHTPSSRPSGGSDGLSSEHGSSSEDEREGASASGGDVVMRWVQRQQNKLRQEGGGVRVGGVAENGDVDMPLIRRRKVILRPTKE